jgi:hypothetical protein
VPFQRPCPADGNAGNFANFQYDIQYFNKLYSDQTKGDATRSVPLRAGSRRVDHVSYDGVEQGTRGEARRYHCSDFFVPKTPCRQCRRNRGTRMYKDRSRNTKGRSELLPNIEGRPTILVE